MRYELRSCEYTAHGLPLNANASTVDDSQSAQAQTMRFFEIRFRHAFYIRWRNRVQIENIRDRDANYAVWVLYRTTIPSI